MRSMMWVRAAGGISLFVLGAAFGRTTAAPALPFQTPEPGAAAGRMPPEAPAEEPAAALPRLVRDALRNPSSPRIWTEIAATLSADRPRTTGPDEAERVAWSIADSMATMAHAAPTALSESLGGTSVPIAHAAEEAADPGTLRHWTTLRTKMTAAVDAARGWSVWTELSSAARTTRDTSFAAAFVRRPGAGAAAAALAGFGLALISAAVLLERRRRREDALATAGPAVPLAGAPRKAPIRSAHKLLAAGLPGAEVAKRTLVARDALRLLARAATGRPDDDPTHEAYERRHTGGHAAHQPLDTPRATRPPSPPPPREGFGGGRVVRVASSERQAP